MRLLLIQFLLSFSIPSLASEFNYPIAFGKYLYQASQGDNIRALKLIKTRTVVNDEALVSELKKKGYVCIRSSSQKRICRQTLLEPKVASEIIQTVDQAFVGFKIVFGDYQKPVLEIDTSQTQEFSLVQDVNINGKKVNRTRYIHYWDQELNRIIFPVSEDQGIPWVNITDTKKVALEFQVRSEQAPEVWSWFLTADLQLAE